MSDMEEPKSFLGIAIHRDRQLLKRFGDCKMPPQRTPMVTSLVANREKWEREKNKNKLEVTSAKTNSPYIEVIGSLLNLTNTVRPYIAYAVNILSRYQISPTDEKWKIVKRVCWHLKYTKSLGLMFGGKLDDLQVFLRQASMIAKAK